MTFQSMYTAFHAARFIECNKLTALKVVGAERPQTCLLEKQVFLDGKYLMLWPRRRDHPATTSAPPVIAGAFTIWQFFESCVSLEAINMSNLRDSTGDL